MKAIVPVKDSSTRVPNKNFKEFHKGLSLFDLTVSKLLKVLNPEDIYMSCENPEKEVLANKWGIQFIPRDPILADNDTPFHKVFNGICDQVEGNHDIAWCQVIDPMFDSYGECFNLWNNGHRETQSCHLFNRDRTKPLKESYDSLVVVYPHKDYYLDDNYKPMGFGFGPWHTKSQSLPNTYQLTFTLSILTRESIKKIGYHVGQNPYWYHAHNPRVDIDTNKDFQVAKAMYSQFALEGQNKPKWSDDSPCCI